MNKISRRDFLKWSGAGLMVASQSREKFAHSLISQIDPDPHALPGEWSLYATTCRECPTGCGMDVRCREGRAIKAEGNPESPVNRGALCARGQSSVQGLYDPDRIPRPMLRSSGSLQNSSWEIALDTVAAKLRASRGKLLVLSDLQTGGMAEVLIAFASAFPSSALLFDEPFNYEPLRRAHQRLYGAAVIPRYHLQSCEFILSFSADFLETWVSPVEFARDFTAMHVPQHGTMGRMAYVGPRLSLTAANADQFVQVTPKDLAGAAAAVLLSVMDQGLSKIRLDDLRPELMRLRERADLREFSPELRTRIAREFSTANGSVALACPAGATGSTFEDSCSIAALLNAAAGRDGQTVDYTQPHALSDTATQAEIRAALQNLTAEDIVVFCNTNPAYSLPDSVPLLKQAGMRVYLGTMPDETAEISDVVLPVHSPLESWGDYEPWSGVHSLMQPVMQPVFDSRHPGDILLELAHRSGKPLARGTAPSALTFESWLHGRWEEFRLRLSPAEPFADFWNQALEQGGVWETQAPAAQPTLQLTNISFSSAASSGDRDLDLWLWPHIFLFDGRLSNRGWMQEIPEPISFVSWNSWLELHPQDGLVHGLSQGDEIEIEQNGHIVKTAVRLTEDIARGTIALSFGQGHTAMGRNAQQRGTNAFDLLGFAEGVDFGRVRLKRTGEHIEFAVNSATQNQYGRHVLQWIEASALDSASGDNLILPLPEGYDPRRDVYAPHDYKNHRWAMVIDLQACIGCGACSTACYAENNVAVVGETEIKRGREQPWLKIVPYRHPEEQSRLGWLPMLCQHCDAAPCEPVCPTYASVHNEEGLNAQIYNRCVGTRYCSNNCPYKVRRFNWLNHEWPEPIHMQLNPEVSVRSRGVMEKCTFCVQRIHAAEFAAARENRELQDGEITPACAQTCPANAIVFGDLLDEHSRVSDLTRHHPRRYHLLEDLNTKPAVTYLRRIQNA